MYTPIQLTDPIYNYRKGTSDDPFPPITEEIKVINNKAFLRERPSELNHVTISGYTEISKKVFYDTQNIATGQFFVDYTSTFIYFNPSAEGLTLTANYYGTGYPLIEAPRVILQSPNPYGLDNLQEFVDYIWSLITQFNNDMANFETELQNKYNEYTQYVDAKLERNIAYMNQKKQEFVDYINGFVNLANQKITEITNQIAYCQTATNNAIQATTNCNTATQTCITETNTCKQIYNATLVNYQPYVSLYSDIANLYPSPQNGWTVATANDDVVYRYDSNTSSWQPKRQFQEIIPPASNLINGLMNKNDYYKLGTIEQGAQKNLVGQDLKDALPNEIKTKTLMFCLGGNVKSGVFPQFEQFPFNGTITGITAFCSGIGDDYLDLTLEKISATDFVGSYTWIDMLSNHVKIPVGKRLNDNTFSFANTTVNAGDFFRINVHYSDETFFGVTVQVNIQY